MNKRATELLIGRDRLKVDEIPNPNDPNDMAEFFEDVIAIEPIGPALKVYTETNVYVFPENQQVEVADE